MEKMELVNEFKKEFPKTWDKFAADFNIINYLTRMKLSEDYGCDISMYINGLLFNMQLWTMTQGILIIPKHEGFVKPEDYVINFCNQLKSAWKILEKSK